MASDRKQKQSNSIPIRFFDGDDSHPSMEEESEEESAIEDQVDEHERELPEPSPPKLSESGLGGPERAELIASRAELKRLQVAFGEAQEALARRQADFDNYRKRIERERGEAHNRIVAEVARKLLPVVDNLARALDRERAVEAGA